MREKETGVYFNPEEIRALKFHRRRLLKEAFTPDEQQSLENVSGRINVYKNQEHGIRRVSHDSKILIREITAYLGVWKRMGQFREKMKEQRNS